MDLLYLKKVENIQPTMQSVIIQNDYISLQFGCQTLNPDYS
jgi:hypothetical protein